MEKENFEIMPLFERWFDCVDTNGMSQEYLKHVKGLCLSAMAWGVTVGCTYRDKIFGYEENND